MIKRLEVVNFKTHARAVFKFGEGVNFVYGPNGSGKTSLMEAVAVALFGSQWVRKVGGKWADFLRRGSPHGEVKLTLVVGGREVVVERRFGESGGLGAYLSVDGSVEARGDTEVTDYVKSKLGLSVDEFRNLLYIRQGELRRILQEPEYIDRVLKLDEFDKVDEVVKDIFNELRARRERAGGRAEELERRVRDAEKRIEELKARLAEAEARVKELEPLAARFRDAERRYFEARERAAALAKEREALEKRLADLARAVAEVERDLEEVERGLAEVEQAKAELASLPQVGDVEKEYYELRQAVAVAEKMPEEVRAYDPRVLEELRRRYEELTKRQAELKSRLELLRDALRLAQRAEGGRCPVCGSPLTREAVQRHELEVAGLEAEVQRLAKALEQVRAEMRGAEELERAYHMYKPYLSLDLREARRRLGELEAQYQLKREVEARRSYLAAVVAKEAALVKRLEELRQRREELGREAVEASARLAEVEEALPKAAAEAEEAEKAYRELRAAYEEYLKAHSRAEELSRELEKAERELASAAAELEKAKAELEKLDKALAAAKNIRAVLGEVKPLARQILLKAINEELNAVFLRLRHKEAFKSVQLVEAGGRYAVRIYTPNGHIEHTLLSLGEQNLLALSLRVALARALIGTAPFMMLDEPTEHLDEEHRRRIVELVRDLTSVVPTVIVTSHLGEFEEVADVVIQL